MFDLRWMPLVCFNQGGNGDLSSKCARRPVPYEGGALMSATEGRNHSPPSHSACRNINLQQVIMRIIAGPGGTFRSTPHRSCELLQLLVGPWGALCSVFSTSETARRHTWSPRRWISQQLELLPKEEASWSPPPPWRSRRGYRGASSHCCVLVQVIFASPQHDICSSEGSRESLVGSGGWSQHCCSHKAKLLTDKSINASLLPPSQGVSRASV